MSMCRVFSCVAERGCLLWPGHSLGKIPSSFCTPRPNLPITPGVSWFPTFVFQSPIMKRTSFLGVSSLGGDSLLAQMVKNLPAIWEIQVWSPGQEDPLEKSMATHSSILAWRIPWTEEPGRLWHKGSQRFRSDWVANTFSNVFLFSMRKKNLIKFNFLLGILLSFLLARSSVKHDWSDLAAAAMQKLLKIKFHFQPIDDRPQRCLEAPWERWFNFTVLLIACRTPVFRRLESPSGLPTALHLTVLLWHCHFLIPPDWVHFVIYLQSDFRLDVCLQASLSEKTFTRRSQGAHRTNRRLQG